ncbi:MAG: DUF3006 family protein [Ruminococcaceae bacterium]|nr:DUF3006 family protein [Oscillospiraceae bacterium]
MNIFIEYLDGDYAVCRLPDKNKNLIRLPLRDLPKGTRELQVVTLRDNGSFFINDYARETRMKQISNYLNFKSYKFNLGE